MLCQEYLNVQLLKYSQRVFLTTPMWKLKNVLGDNSICGTHSESDNKVRRLIHGTHLIEENETINRKMRCYN